MALVLVLYSFRLRGRENIYEDLIWRICYADLFYEIISIFYEIFFWGIFEVDSSSTQYKIFYIIVYSLMIFSYHYSVLIAFLISYISWQEVTNPNFSLVLKYRKLHKYTIVYLIFTYVY